MAQAVACHDALLRDTIEAYRGRIVKTTGDGIYAAFSSPVDCLGAVIDIQLALLDPAATAGMRAARSDAVCTPAPCRRATMIISAARSIARRGSWAPRMAAKCSSRTPLPICCGLPAARRRR